MRYNSDEEVMAAYNRIQRREGRLPQQGEMAAALGVTKGAVYYRLRAMGLPLGTPTMAERVARMLEAKGAKPFAPGETPESRAKERCRQYRIRKRDEGREKWRAEHPGEIPYWERPKKTEEEKKAYQRMQQEKRKKKRRQAREARLALEGEQARARPGRPPAHPPLFGGDRSYRVEVPKAQEEKQLAGGGLLSACRRCGRRLFIPNAREWPYWEYEESGEKVYLCTGCGPGHRNSLDSRYLHER